MTDQTVKFDVFSLLEQYVGVGLHPASPFL